MIFAKMVAKAVVREMMHATVNMAIHKLFGSTYGRNNYKNERDRRRNKSPSRRKRDI